MADDRTHRLARDGVKRVILRPLPATTAALEHSSLVELDRKEVRVVA
jgi:hypothetical protein